MLSRFINVASAPLAVFELGDTKTWVTLTVVVLAALFFTFFLLLVNRFKRCPSNRVLVIYGKVGGGNTARCIHGGGAVGVALLQGHHWLTPGPMQIGSPPGRRAANGNNRF